MGGFNPREIKGMTHLSIQACALEIRNTSYILFEVLLPARYGRIGKERPVDLNGSSYKICYVVALWG